MMMMPNVREADFPDALRQSCHHFGDVRKFHSCAVKILSQTSEKFSEARLSQLGG